jgi:hypothetical protein
MKALFSAMSAAHSVGFAARHPMEYDVTKESIKL